MLILCGSNFFIDVCNFIYDKNNNNNNNDIFLTSGHSFENEAEQAEQKEIEEQQRDEEQQDNETSTILKSLNESLKHTKL